MFVLSFDSFLLWKHLFKLFTLLSIGLFVLVLNSVIFNVYSGHKDYFKYLLQIFSPYLCVLLSLTFILSRFRITAKLRGRDRDSPYALHISSFPHFQHSLPEGRFVVSDAFKFTDKSQLLKSIVYLMVHSSCAFNEFEQIYNNMYLSMYYHK